MQLKPLLTVFLFGAVSEDFTQKNGANNLTQRRKGHEENTAFASFAPLREI
jgi:hypothetical protein